MKETKKAKADRAKEILHKYPIGSSVKDPEDLKFLLELFKMHPHYFIKIGCGLADIVIKLTGFKNRCFYILRRDGSCTDISYLVCINGAGTKKSDIKIACRSAVTKTILEFRDTNVVFGKTICPISGEILTKENTHIDHYDLTFQELFDLWIKNKDIDFLHSKLNIGTADNELRIYFTDENIINEFVDFHNKFTHLRAVSRTANLSLLKK